MSNNRRNSLSIDILKSLFPKLNDRSITSDEKDILRDQFNLLKETGKITENEWNILFAVLNKITSVESRTKIIEQLPNLNNATKAVREQQLAKTLDIDEIYYLQNILLKLQEEGHYIEVYISPVYSDIITNEFFKEFIITKKYQHPPYVIIGRGKFGKVFLLQLNRHLFVLKEIILQHEHSLIAVQREIRALQMVIGKDYAVQLIAYAMLIDKDLTLGKLGTAYILYPYIPGETLADYQETEHLEEDAEENEKKIYSHIIQAVEKLHTETGLLHSDIKPENIWIPKNRAYPPFLLDFGLIQSLNSEQARNVGTSYYWSEKRLRSKGKTIQRMTPGINWLALARTLSGEFPNTNNSQLPPLRERFKQLYHSKLENTIIKSNINYALAGTVQQQLRNKVHAQRTQNRSVQRSNRNGNGNRNENRNRNGNRNRNTKKVKK